MPRLAARTHHVCIRHRETTAVVVPRPDLDDALLLHRDRHWWAGGDLSPQRSFPRRRR